MNDFKLAYERWKNTEQLLPILKEELLSLTDESEIEDRFYCHLQFGTAGLRGIIGAGTNRVNLYTIRRATQGFARYLLAEGNSMQEKGVVIAYDSRTMSKDFAKEAAGVLAYNGIKVFLFHELRPTPMLSFALRFFQAAGGIMITASHNPPEYNGYKVYNEMGGQISTEIASLILDEILTIKDELTLPTLSVEAGIQQGLIQIIGEEIDQAYTKYLTSLSLRPDVIQQIAHTVPIVFTPLHGTGHRPVKRVLEELGFSNLHIVPEQALPDPQFSTVSSPNPEEKQAFELAIALAEDVHADVILGTDPDADRLGVVAQDAKGAYVVFNGNQVGSLLLHYILEQKKVIGELPANGVMVKTIVTSELGRAIAGSYHVQTVETLTGFKYIAEKIEEYQQSGEYTFLFGYEESFGYLIGNFVRDKDAVQAAMLTAEMTAYYKQKGMTLLDALEQLQEKYGFYTDEQLSLTFKGKEGVTKISQMMDKVREEPLTNIGGLAVKTVKDYLHGADGLPPSNVVKYVLEDGSWVAFRPSGTEPKMKIYSSVVDATLEKSEQKANEMREFLLNLLQVPS